MTSLKRMLETSSGLICSLKFPGSKLKMLLVESSSSQSSSSLDLVFESWSPCQLFFASQLRLYVISRMTMEKGMNQMFAFGFEMSSLSSPNSGVYLKASCAIFLFIKSRQYMMLISFTSTQICLSQPQLYRAFGCQKIGNRIFQAENLDHVFWQD